MFTATFCLKMYHMTWLMYLLSTSSDEAAAHHLVKSKYKVQRQKLTSEELNSPKTAAEAL